jgi:peptidylprolyl isomerase
MRFAILSCTLLLGACATGLEATSPALPAAPAKTAAKILEESPASDWRRLDPENTLYMELASGRVIIELAPLWAPRSVANIRTLAREKYFDGLGVIRVQDNFVAQWGDRTEKKPIGSAKKTIPAEFTRAITPDLPFVPLPDRDVYAPQTGYSGGFPAARDPASNRAWLVHCYASVGVGRDNAEDSGNGAELYAVIGNAPRALDRNITVAGRIVKGIELLSSLPRGTGALGFYEKPEMDVAIKSVRLMSDVPVAERTPLELLRIDSDTFRALVESRRFRKDEWYKVPPGAIDVCANSLPTRTPKATP